MHQVSYQLLRSYTNDVYGILPFYSGRYCPPESSII